MESDLFGMVDIASLVSKHLSDHLLSIEFVDFEVGSNGSVAEFLADSHDVEDLVAGFVVVEGVCHGDNHGEDFRW